MQKRHFASIFQGLNIGKQQAVWQALRLWQGEILIFGRWAHIEKLRILIIGEILFWCDFRKINFMRNHFAKRF